ncbi:MAG: hypothetical protein R3F19_07105 [Verrucomicrobiales bacterium]
MQKIVPGIYAVAMCLLGYALGPGAGSVVVDTSESGGQLPELQSPLVTETVSAGFTLAEMAEDVASDYPAIIQELWMGDDPAKEDRLLLVIAQWCEIAPEAAIEYLKELGRAWQENVDARGVSLGQYLDNGSTKPAGRSLRVCGREWIARLRRNV